MATNEELFASVRLIKEYCNRLEAYECFFECPLKKMCNECFRKLPEDWPDPEGGGEG